MLELTNVTRMYGSMAAVSNVNLSIPEGEFLTILGSSGSGKTTTLMMIAGFVEPSAGEIFVGGKCVTQLPPGKRDLGVVFQNYALFPHLTVAENVGFPLEMRGVSKSERTELIRRVLDIIKLGDRADKYPRQLSGGQQQRVALARALVFQPRALLMDEPLGALDKKLREHMQSEIIRIQEEVSATIIYVTHDQEEALTMSDRIAVMQEGEIIQIGPPAELYDRPANRWVAEFIGQSNFLEGAIDTIEAGKAGIRFNNGAYCHVDANAIANARRGEELTLALRPERSRLMDAAKKPTSTKAFVAGVIRERTYLGHTSKTTVRLIDGTDFIVQEQNSGGERAFETGDEVIVTWTDDDLWPVPRGTKR